MPLKIRLALLLSCLALSACGFSTTLHQVTITSAAAYRPGSALRVTSENGSVTVERASRSDVSIIAKVRAQTPERAQAVKILSDRSNDGALFIRAIWPERRKNNEGCTFEISLPEAQGVDLETSNGSIILSGLAGAAELHTSNGSIEVHGHNGPVEASSSNGSFKLHQLKGPVRAETSNGHIKLSLEGIGPVIAETSNGSIDLDIDQSFQGELTADTSNGSVRVSPEFQRRVSSFGKTHARLGFGAGAPSQLSTSNGFVEVH